MSIHKLPGQRLFTLWFGWGLPLVLLGALCRCSPRRRNTGTDGQWHHRRGLPLDGKKVNE